MVLSLLILKLLLLQMSKKITRIWLVKLKVFFLSIFKLSRPILSIIINIIYDDVANIININCKNSVFADAKKDVLKDVTKKIEGRAKLQFFYSIILIFNFVPIQSFHLIFLFNFGKFLEFADKCTSLSNSTENKLNSKNLNYNLKNVFNSETLFLLIQFNWT